MYIKTNENFKTTKFYKSRFLLLMMLLPTIYFILFKFGPMFGFIMAFKDYNPSLGIFHSKWVGLKHFKSVLSDPWFFKVFANTILLNIYVLIFYFPMPIILSVMINEVHNTHYKKLVQTISYLPYFLSTVVVAGIVVNSLSSEGIVNNVLESMGFEPIFFMLRPEWFRPVYVMTVMWQNTGWDTIIYLAALTGINIVLYEAAYIDGANRFQRIIHITIPGIVPIISILFLLQVGRMLSVGFERVLMLYNSSIYETADVVQTYVYRRGIANGDFSYGATIDLINGIVVLILIVSANKLSKRMGGNSLW